MAYLFKQRFTMLVGVSLSLICLSGCLSYQYERKVVGVEISDPGDTYSLGKTTIGDVLLDLGAPQQVHSLDDSDLLVYQRSLYQESGLSLGLPALEVLAGGSIDISASGALTRYDTLTFWFNSQGTLEDVVFEKSSDKPYFKTLFPE
jgi:hypothetical protein